MRRTVKAAFALAGWSFAIPVWAQQFDRDAMAPGVMRDSEAYEATAVNEASQRRGWSSAYGLHREVSVFDWLVSRHWFDSIPPAFSALTLGYRWREVKFEGSVIKDREREGKRIDIAASRLFDVTSGTLSYHPSAAWTFQIGRIRFNRPDQFDRTDEIRRTMLSARYARSFDRNHWQTTLSAGQSLKKANDSATNTYLLESLLRLGNEHTLFGRLERAAADELFRERDVWQGASFNASKITLGYVYDFPARGAVKLGIGGTASKGFIPRSQAAALGNDPTSYTLFVRLLVQYP